MERGKKKKGREREEERHTQSTYKEGKADKNGLSTQCWTQGKAAAAADRTAGRRERAKLDMNDRRYRDEPDWKRNRYRHVIFGQCGQEDCRYNHRDSERLQ